MKTTFYQGGWRPAFGWAGLMIVVVNYVAFPVAFFFASLYGVEVDQPQPPVEALATILTAVVSIAGMRSFDKLKKIDTKELV